MPPKKNRIGHKFNHLTVTKDAGSRMRGGKKRIFYFCKCDCGKEDIEVCIEDLVSNKRKSCGCQDSKEKHGMSDTPEYQAWVNMIARCHNPDHPKYPDYGGRGITVCPEFRESFEEFYQHVGPRPNEMYSLDRIYNERGYEWDNIRWATIHEQNKNRREQRR